MKKITTKRNVFTLLFTLCIFIQCEDKSTEIVADRVVFSSAEKEQIQISASRLNSYLSSMAIQGLRKEELKERLNLKNFLGAYLNSIVDPNEKQFTLELLENKKMKNLMAWFDPSTEPTHRGKEAYSPFDDLSIPVKEIADHMNDRINSVTEEYMSTTQSFNSDELSALLKHELSRMEADIQNNTVLQSDEKLALLAIIIMQNESMNSMVAIVKSSFESNSAGKIAINWRRIGSIVGSVIVQAALVALAVVIIVQTAGIGGWLAQPLITGSFTWLTGGVALGGGIGFAFGLSYALIENQCLISVNDGYGDCG